jgi:hypothetical protein
MTLPNFKLIQPGSVLGQPKQLNLERLLVPGLLFGQPSLQLLGGMRRSIVQDQTNHPHPTAHGFWKQDFQDERLEIDKAAAFTTTPKPANSSLPGPAQRCPRCGQMGNLGRFIIPEAPAGALGLDWVAPEIRRAKQRFGLLETAPMLSCTVLRQHGL